MKRVKMITVVLTFIMWSGFQVVSAQVTDPNEQNQTPDQTINQDMVSDAWERDWDNMDDKQREVLNEEWNYSSETDRQQRRQQEIDDMTTEKRDQYTQNLQDRRDKWQNMSVNEREQFGKRVLDYYSGDSVHQYYGRQ